MAWFWTGLVAIASLTVFVVGGGFGSRDPSETAGALVVPTLFAALGSLIATRQPGNRISWLFFVVAIWGVLESAAELRVDSQPDDPASAWDVMAVIWLNSGFFFALLIPLFLLLFLFPTGQFLTRRWSWGGWVAGLLAAEVFLVEAFAEEVGLDEGTWTITNPIGFIAVDGMENSGIFVSVFGIGLIALMLGGLAAIVVRYRRSPLLVRTQIKWVVFAMLVLVIMFASRLFVEQWRDGPVANFIFAFSLALVPISITVAITRYRLFEIDRLISRTVTYLMVVGLLGLVFVAGVVWVPQLLGLDDSPLLVAVSTLAVAALFNPTRKRVQRAVDRRFNRSRYQAQLISGEFAAGLQDSLTVEEHIELWVRTVNQALQPAVTDVWLQPGKATTKLRR